MRNQELRQQLVSCMTVIAMMVNQFGEEAQDGSKSVILKRDDMEKLKGYDISTEAAGADLKIKLTPKGVDGHGGGSVGGNIEVK